MKSDFNITLVSSDMPRLYELKKELNCDVYPTLITRRISPFLDMISICKLWRYFRKEKFKIVHAHIPKGGLIGMMSSWLACVPNRIYTLHGLLFETSTGLKRKLLLLSDYLSCKLATKVLAVSPSVKHRAIEEGICPESKIIVLGNGSACGINLDNYTRDNAVEIRGQQIRREYNIPDEAIVIGYIGRVVPDKGIKELVEAFVKLQHDISDSFLLLIGEVETVRKDLDVQTLSIIKDCDNICSSNAFTADVQAVYAAIDILVLPSRREGLGMTLIEAAAMGLPTVATKVTGCVDAVVDNVTGLLAALNDPEDLYKVMLKLALDPELRKELGANGQQRVRKLFDSKLLIEEHLKLYENMITSGIE